MIAILHNIRSIYNVASISRTADGAGVEKLYLTGYTPGPIDRFGHKRKKFAKVALGAEDAVEYERKDDIHTLITALKANDKCIYPCEPRADAVDYRDIKANSEQAVLVFGNEPDGLPKNLIDACDQTIQIPMRGRKSSLNVSVAFGVLAYGIDK